MQDLKKVDSLVDALVTYGELSPYPKALRQKWSVKVHRPIDEQTLSAIRRASATGLPYGSEARVKRLAKKLDLDLTIRPRGRPRKAPSSN